jgi:hypothetical protein
MAHDHNDIYTIVERLRILEEGLNKNQKSVNQLGATFRPKTIAVLTAPKDPKNPLAGKLVGGCEESSDDNAINAEMLQDHQIAAEGKVDEDVLDKVKSSFSDYLKSIEDKYRDSNLKDKKHEDTDIKEKDKTDRDLIAKEESELGSALSGEIPAQQPAGEPGVSMKEAAPVKTITNECGLWEVHGDEKSGFEIRRGNRQLPTRFKNLNEAELALEMFNARQRKRDEAADYIDEA